MIKSCVLGTAVFLGGQAQGMGLAAFSPCILLQVRPGAAQLGASFMLDMKRRQFLTEGKLSIPEVPMMRYLQSQHLTPVCGCGCCLDFDLVMCFLHLYLVSQYLLENTWIYANVNPEFKLCQISRQACNLASCFWVVGECFKTFLHTCEARLAASF